MAGLKALSVALVLAFALPGCARFTEQGRLDRAYHKHMKQMKSQREKRRKQLIERKRAEMPSLRNNPPPLQPSFEPAPQSQ